jgi:hypothetical protein
MQNFGQMYTSEVFKTSEVCNSSMLAVLVYLVRTTLAVWLRACTTYTPVGWSRGR